ncbi:MAG: hypothetical protein HZA72_04115 [Candidatus Omnitrophica bacterium]|nr:hypothetical protein [Candidatus Omnitrophota bacterium]
MKKAIIPILIMAGIIIFMAVSYRSIFVRTVNYEIAGIKIPSKYSLLTGKVTPIHNYRGKAQLPSMQPSIKGNLGLSSEQAQAARLRWALFEEWVTEMPEYKDWQSNPETFRNAMADFRKFISGE